MDSGESDERMLFEAIRSNDNEKVRSILSKNSELLVMVKNPESCKDKLMEMKASPLWEAMLGGHAEIVELLIKEFRANPNEKYSGTRDIGRGYTFLHYTTELTDLTEEIDQLRYSNDLKVAKILIQHGADVNEPYPPLSENSHGSLLCKALYNINLDFAELLIINGAEINGDSAVFNIFSFDDKEINIASLLLLQKYGLDLANFRTKDGENILHLFSEGISRSMEVVEFLLDSGVPLNGTDNDGDTPLSRAIVNGIIEVVKFLVHKGAKINTRNNLGQTLLHSLVCTQYCSCEQSHREIARFIIQHGVDINARDNEGNTAFFERNPELYGIYRSQITNVIIDEIAKQESFDSSLVSALDLNVIHKFPIFEQHYQQCKMELSLMESIKFYPPYSYFSVLKMSKNVKKLTNLTKNEEFVAAFKQNTRNNLGQNLIFPRYSSDLQHILEKAIALRDKILIVENRLNIIFKDLLPVIVIKKLAENLEPEDLPSNPVLQLECMEIE